MGPSPLLARGAGSLRAARGPGRASPLRGRPATRAPVLRQGAGRGRRPAANKAPAGAGGRAPAPCGWAAGLFGAPRRAFPRWNAADALVASNPQLRASLLPPFVAAVMPAPLCAARWASDLEAGSVRPWHPAGSGFALVVPSPRPAVRPALSDLQVVSVMRASVRQTLKLRGLMLPVENKGGRFSSPVSLSAYFRKGVAVKAAVPEHQQLGARLAACGTVVHPRARWAAGSPWFG